MPARARAASHRLSNQDDEAAARGSWRRAVLLLAAPAFLCTAATLPISLARIRALAPE